jgi:cobalt/nickel transport system permease protein
MHIAEGVLSAPVLIAGAVGAAAAVAYGLKKLPSDRLMTAALSSAAFFVASLIHVPIGVTSAHLLLTGLIGILMGWASFPVILVALLLQSVFFQFGGFTVLGVNTLTMGTGAIAAYYLFNLAGGRSGSAGRQSAAAFAAGFAGVAVSAVATAIALMATEEGFKAAAIALLAAHLPIMIAEGVISLLVVNLLRRAAPELLAKPA